MTTPWRQSQSNDRTKGEERRKFSIENFAHMWWKYATALQITKPRRPVVDLAPIPVSTGAEKINFPILLQGHAIVAILTVSVRDFVVGNVLRDLQPVGDVAVRNGRLCHSFHGDYSGPNGLHQLLVGVVKVLIVRRTLTDLRRGASDGDLEYVRLSHLGVIWLTRIVPAAL